MNDMKVLIIEDSVKINHMLTKFLSHFGYEVSQAFDGEEAIGFFNQMDFDLVLTDLMLPSIQGEDIIKIIKQRSNCYIIVISAKVSLDDRLDVLRLGVDDYITKPFSIEEVIAKCQNIEKRIQPNKLEKVSFDNNHIIIYPNSRQVFSHQTEITLTKNEFHILWFLIRNANQICTRNQLLDACLDDHDSYDRVIDVHIKNIRKKLNQSSDDYEFIKTHYGIGYQWVGNRDD